MEYDEKPDNYEILARECNYLLPPDRRLLWPKIDNPENVINAIEDYIDSCRSMDREQRDLFQEEIRKEIRDLETARLRRIIRQELIAEMKKGMELV